MSGVVARQTKRECELAALLINALTPALLTLEDLIDGLRMLLEAAEDLRYGCACMRI